MTIPKSENFKNYCEGAFGVAKIVALAAVGLWTYHQWDKTVFPKETHEQFLRKAAVRTDIEVNDIRLSLRDLSTASEAIDQETQAVLVSVQAIIKNSSSFPVLLAGDDVSFSISGIDLDRMNSELEDSYQPLIETGRSSLLELDLDYSDISNKSGESSSIIEGGGLVQIAFQEIVRVPRSHPADVALVEFSFNAKVTPVNPESNDVATDVTRNKKIVISEIRQIDTSTVTKDGVEYSLRAIETGGRSSPAVSIADFTPIFEGEFFGIVPSES